MSQIDIYLAMLDQLAPVAVDAARTTQILQRKQQLYTCRDRLLQSYLAPQQPLNLQRSIHGKPYLPDSDIEFNHSHSQQHYALAISRSVLDLGIDIEDLQRQVRFDALAKHAFHAQEYEIWQHSHDPEYWFKVWTTKEAVLKASGLGIRMSLKQLNTQVQHDEWQGKMQHLQLGNFSYQHVRWQHSLLTVAWREAERHPDLNLHLL